jgi:eukaryotic-like serine/threonine-protein kinase
LALVDRVELGEGSVVHGSYRLTRQLGQGGMGSVWEAEHLRLPKQVAIKFLLGAGTSHPELLARFRREAEIGSRLGHPNIVEVHDFNVLSDGTPYIVMERLRGKDLRARLGEGPLSLEEARSATLQVASALALAHKEGVVHRDLKPENIFLCEQGDGSLRVKILDFGISKIQGPGTHATRDDRILGTPGYMAPEQAMGKNSAIDGRTDLFALAAIFYEMLTGKSVFLGTTLAEVVYKVVHHTPEPLSVVTPDVPAAISSAVQQALSKDPAERQPSVQAFVAALTSDRPAPFVSQAPAVDVYGGTVAVSTGDERLATSGAAPSQRAARAPRSAWFAGGALAVLAVGLGVWALSGARAPRPAPPAAPDPGVSARPEQPPEPAVAQPVVDAAQGVSPESAQQPAAAEPASAQHAGASEAAPKQVPSAVRAALEQAESALRAGDFASALRLARASLYEAKTPEAYAIMTQAYCGQRDVGMAVAMLRNLRSREQRAARAYCEKLGLTLAR